MNWARVCRTMAAGQGSIQKWSSNFFLTQTEIQSNFFQTPETSQFFRDVVCEIRLSIDQRPKEKPGTGHKEKPGTLLASRPSYVLIQHRNLWKAPQGGRGVHCGCVHLESQDPPTVPWWSRRLWLLRTCATTLVRCRCEGNAEKSLQIASLSIPSEPFSCEISENGKCSKCWWNTLIPDFVQVFTIEPNLFAVSCVSFSPFAPWFCSKFLSSPETPRNFSESAEISWESIPSGRIKTLPPMSSTFYGSQKVNSKVSFPVIWVRKVKKFNLTFPRSTSRIKVPVTLIYEGNRYFAIHTSFKSWAQFFKMTTSCNFLRSVLKNPFLVVVAGHYEFFLAFFMDFFNKRFPSRSF